MRDERTGVWQSQPNQRIWQLTFACILSLYTTSGPPVYCRARPFHTSTKGDNMKLRSTRMVLGVIGGSALCLMGVVLARGQAGQAQRPQMAEEGFKNVQVLKGIPVDEF